MRELTEVEIGSVSGAGECPANLPKEVTINGQRYSVSCSVGDDGRVTTTLTPIND